MDLLQLFRQVTTFVFDVDGVLTDGTLTILPEGVMARSMNVKDGYALQLAIKKGYRVLIISGGISPDVEERLRKLGVTEVYMKVTDKVSVLTGFLTQHGINTSEVLYMGDDVPDVEVMQMSGLPCCPRDAVRDIKAIATYISPYNGGFGCCRDVIEKTLRLQGRWNEDTHIPSA